MAVAMDDFLEKIAGYGNRPALAGRKGKISYKTLLEGINRYAQQLKDMGVGNGDIAGVMLGNGPEFVHCLFAVWQLGAVAVPINILYRHKELDYIIRHSGMKVLIGTSSLGKMMPGLGSGITFADTVIYRTNPITFPGKINEVGVAIIIYTSGTTSKPKGVMLTFENLQFNIISWLEVVKQSEDDIVLLALPFFHIFGLTLTLLSTMYVGGMGVLLPRFSPDEAASLIEGYKVSIFPGVPAMFIRLLDVTRVQASQLATLRFCVSGGSPLSGRTIKSFEDTFKVPIIEGYGLSEASPLVSVTPPHAVRKIGSVGFPIPRVEVSVVDEKGNNLALDAVGEIVVKGRNIMIGYYKMPQITESTLRDGYLYTGDLGKIDEDGYLSIVDRRKDLIITNGYNVYPREVEETIIAKSEVMEAAVIGVNHPVKGEAVKAYVVLRDGLTCGADDIIAYCKLQSASFKAPQEVEFVAFLPKNITGKVLKNELRHRHAAQQAN